MFLIDEGYIKRHEVLDGGTFGSIMPYYTPKNCRKYVVKELDVIEEKNLNMIINEAMIGFNHDHPFILPVLGCSYNHTTHKFYIKMKKMNSNLHVWRRNQKGQIEREMFIRNFYRLASALHYLHSKKQVHCDIKANNILLDNNNNMFIADLGLSKFFGEDGSLSDVSILGGTEIYMAPEIHQYWNWKKSKEPGVRQVLKKRELYSGDVWSLGITFVDLFVGLFKGIDYKRIETSPDLEVELMNRLKDIPESYGRDILQGMLQIEAKKRLNFEQVCELLEKRFGDILEETYEIQARKIFYRKVICEKYCELQAKNDYFATTKDISIKPDEPLKVDDKKFTEMMEDFTKKLNEDADAKIQSISVDMSWCKNLTDHALSQLLIDFPKKYKTEFLSLNFSSCENITDKGIDEMAGQNFPNVRNLKQLNLDFSGCKEITDQGLKSIIERICANLLNLKTLSINFSECSRIENKDLIMKWIGEDLNRMINLKEVYLDFARCEGIDEEAKNGLKKELTRIKHIQIY